MPDEPPPKKDGKHLVLLLPEIGEWFITEGYYTKKTGEWEIAAGNPVDVSIVAWMPYPQLPK